MGLEIATEILVGHIDKSAGSHFDLCMHSMESKDRSLANERVLALFVSDQRYLLAIDELI